LNPLKKLFQQSFVYGVASVLPRVFSFLLLRVHTGSLEEASGYGEYANIYAWIAFFNVFLAYGMETAFFRFFHKEKNASRVISTSLVSLACSSLLFGLLGFVFSGYIADLTGIRESFLRFTLSILVLDALVIIPFALIRAKEKPMRYAWLKLLSAGINFGLNLFFLVGLPIWAVSGNSAFLENIYRENFQIEYILISNVVASGLILLILAPTYFRAKFEFNFQLWSRMMRYALPILIAGIAYTINEVFDKILLTNLASKEEAGIYAACYKLAVFMTLFGTAFRLGVEPFFFSQAKEKNAEETYAQITHYFILLGSIILLAVVVFIPVLAGLFINNPNYYRALDIVPIILLASFCLGIYHNLSVWYKVTDRTRFGALISSLGAVITLSVNIYFIPLYGFWASAIATLAAYGSMMVLSFALGRRYYPIPYRIGRALFYMFLSFGLASLSYYYFDASLVPGAALLFVFLVLITLLEYKSLKALFRREHTHH
jgi:O-antigen/teichoic acid export membrane protein